MALRDQWTIVLAAGEGSRLRKLTVGDDGNVVPKQFCALTGSRSLLAQTIARGQRLVAPSHIVVVVAATHERLWRRQLASLPSENVIVQPTNRGTAIGLLLALTAIARRDSEAVVAVLPSDHFIRREDIWLRSLGTAMRAAVRGDMATVLLGITPDAAESDYGWIVPGPGRGPVRRVRSFVEKPPATVAAAMLAQGALWNSFSFAAHVRVISALIERCAPGVARAFGDALLLGHDALGRLYDVLPHVDLSRDVLQEQPESLGVLEVPACGWTDLGTPERVTACLSTLGRTDLAEAMGIPHRPGCPNLALRVREQVIPARTG